MLGPEVDLRPSGGRRGPGTREGEGGSGGMRVCLLYLGLEIDGVGRGAGVGQCQAPQAVDACPFSSKTMVPADETYSTRACCVWSRQKQGAEKLYTTGRRSVLHLSGVARGNRYILHSSDTPV